MMVMQIGYAPRLMGMIIVSEWLLMTYAFECQMQRFSLNISRAI